MQGDPLLTPSLPAPLPAAAAGTNIPAPAAAPGVATLAPPAASSSTTPAPALAPAPAADSSAELARMRAYLEQLKRRQAETSPTAVRGSGASTPPAGSSFGRLKKSVLAIDVAREEEDELEAMRQALAKAQETERQRSAERARVRAAGGGPEVGDGGGVGSELERMRLYLMQLQQQQQLQWLSGGQPRTPSGSSWREPGMGQSASLQSPDLEASRESRMSAYSA